MGTKYNDRSLAGKKLLELNSILKTEERVLGHISNFEIVGKRDDFLKISNYYLKGAYKYPLELSTNLLGNILKIENTLKNIPNRKLGEEENLKKAETQFNALKEEIKKPFNREAELNELLIEKENIYKELGIDDVKDQVVMEETNEIQKELDI